MRDFDKGMRDVRVAACALAVAVLLLPCVLFQAAAYADDAGGEETHAWTVDVEMPEGASYDGGADAVTYLYRSEAFPLDYDGDGTLVGDVGELAGIGYGDRWQLVLDEGFYVYRTKAAGCAAKEGAFYVSGEGRTEVALAAQGAWTGDVDRSWYDLHSSDDTLYLRTAEDLAGLGALLSEGVSFAGKTLELMGDLDLSGAEWTPLGSFSMTSHSWCKPFDGTFDGNGHVVEGLRVERKANNGGLFEELHGGVVRDLTVRGSVETGEYGYVGGISASARDSSFVNCKVDLDIRCGSSYVGGIVGHADSGARVSSCRAHGSMTVASAGSGFGGIVGRLGTGGVIDGCVNEMSLRIVSQGGSYVNAVDAGGIVGDAVGSNMMVLNSVNKGAVESNAPGVGGVAGAFSTVFGGSGTLSGNRNEGTVACTAAGSAAHGVGGVAGELAGSLGAGDVLEVSRCANHGDVSFSGAQGSASVGGLVGRLAVRAGGGSGGSALMEACYSTGALSNGSRSDGAALGGVAGLDESDASIALGVQGCYVAGSATTAQVVPYALTEGFSLDASVRDFYYLDGFADQVCASDAGTEGAEALPRATMTSASFIDTLNRATASFRQDDQGENDGYPVLGEEEVKIISIVNVSTNVAGSIVYDGNAHPLQVEVRGDDGSVLAEGVDYTLALRHGGELIDPSQPRQAGSYTVTVAGMGDYVGVASLSYNIERRFLGPDDFKPIASVPYTGEPVDPSSLVQVADGLGFGVDELEVSAATGSDLVSVGTHTLVVKGASSSIWGIETRLTFEVRPGQLEMDAVDAVPYTGKPPAIRVTVRNGAGATLVAGMDYDLSYAKEDGSVADLGSLTDPGTYYVTAAGRGNYDGAVCRQPFQVTLGAFSVDDVAEMPYTGAAAEPELTVRNANNPDLVLETPSSTATGDYVVSYEDAAGRAISSADLVDVGDYVAVVTGKGPRYDGNCVVRVPFRIVDANFSVRMIDDLRYNGQNQLPRIEARSIDGTELVEGSDYTVAYWWNGIHITPESVKGKGAYTAVVEGTGRYHGTFERAFEVLPALMTADEPASQEYTGSALKPVVRAYGVGHVNLVEGSDYAVRYYRDGVEVDASAVVAAGEYEVVLAGQGNYAGELRLSFKVEKATLVADPLGDLPYTGREPSIAPVVYAGGAQLDASALLLTFYRDGYQVGAWDIVDLGSYEVEVSVLPDMRRNFADGGATVRIPFKVVPATPEIDPVESVAFDGLSHTPDIVVRSGGVVLDPGLYTLSYRDSSGRVLAENEMMAAGDYTVTMHPKDPSLFAVESVSAVFTIRQGYLTVQPIPDVTYTGGPVKPSIVVLYGGGRLKDSEYTVTYTTTTGVPVASDELIAPGSYRAYIVPKSGSNYVVMEYSGAFNIVMPENAGSDPGGEGGGSGGAGDGETGAPGAVGNGAGGAGSAGSSGGSGNGAQSGSGAGSAQIQMAGRSSRSGEGGSDAGAATGSGSGGPIAAQGAASAGAAEAAASAEVASEVAPSDPADALTEAAEAFAGLVPEFARSQAEAAYRFVASVPGYAWGALLAAVFVACALLTRLFYRRRSQLMSREVEEIAAQAAWS